MPKISVLIPSYNSADFIEECIKSVVNQSLENIEILCIDANSNDGTLKILQEYALKDKRIQIILSDRKSFGYQLNLGIQNAKGKYFTIVESDDYVDLTMCEKLWRLAEICDCDMIKADIFGFEKGIFGRNFKYLSMARVGFGSKVYGKVSIPKEEKEIIKYTWTMNQSGIYKLDFVRKFSIYANETDGASYQDFGLWFLMMANANSVYFHKEALYFYRQDNQNSSVNNKNKVYCVCDESKFVENYIKINQKDDMEQIFLYRKFKLYLWNLKRIDKKFKLEFLEHFGKEFKNKKLDSNIFNKNELKEIEEIINNPKSFLKRQKSVLWKIEKNFARWRRKFIGICETSSKKYSFKG
ncbi:glycosyl transferase [Helicobacter pullorum]|nr:MULTISPECIES: glycosyltransferase family 2 protein [Helicobacter]KAB0575050.1 glycosyltransferase family 2 protein [Helicobacter pullorum NCTC 12824]MCI7047204.1 glycosyltransferase family 2 protein [Helicobacter sp.]OCR04736.1 glycosyl transferase [Helicobacter pullorum]OCR08061.1 glycosyl transferase [Helicobacter pullorum]OCR09024.1 glycosyl transferase [Helicobacter pullorum]